MSAEILEQPEVFQRVLDHGRRDIDALAALLVDHPPQFVLLAGRGTSDHAAEYAKYLIEVRLGIPCGLVSPSTVTAYESTMSVRGVLYIAVSQSGTSPDLVASLAAARSAGAVTLAVTNSPGSALASAAQHHLDVLAGPELAVAATKSYTAELLTLLLLVDSWSTGATASLLSPASLDSLLAAAEVLAARSSIESRVRGSTTSKSCVRARRGRVRSGSCSCSILLAARCCWSRGTKRATGRAGTSRASRSRSEGTTSG